MSTPRYIPEKGPRPAQERDAEDQTVTPSQAEGDRSPDEQGDDGQGHVQPTPSQAEGDRETVERNLEEQI